MATSPLLSRGPKEGVNAASPLPSRKPKRDRKCHATLAFSRVPNTNREDKNLKGCLSPTFSGAQERAEMLLHPCILRGPQNQAQGAKSEVAASTQPSRRPKRGRKCYVTPAFLGVPNAKRGDQIQKWLPHPCLLGSPKKSENVPWPLHSPGSPTPSAGTKIRSGHLTPAFSAPQCRGEMLRHHCILRVPQRQAGGSGIRSGSPTPSFFGAEKREERYVTPALSGICNA